MQRVLFVDFDGVLNTERYQAELRNKGEKQWDGFGPVFDPVSVQNLKTILDAVPDALLVINSSWKLEGIERMRQLWMARGLPGMIHSITPDNVPSHAQSKLDNYGDMLLVAGKGYEVSLWLKEHVLEVCNYVILDDIHDYLPEQESHLILTNPRNGITVGDALKVISILNEPATFSFGE